MYVSGAFQNKKKKDLFGLGAYLFLVMADCVCTLITGR